MMELAYTAIFFGLFALAFIILTFVCAINAGE